MKMRKKLIVMLFAVLLFANMITFRASATEPTAPAEEKIRVGITYTGAYDIYAEAVKKAGAQPVKLALATKKALEEEALEAEKERVRAERRAANPEGITANTSKKKIQQAKQKEQEAAKVAAAKEYAAKKGIAPQEEEKENSVMSGIPARPYCKGRAYDPNRYNNKE